MVDLEKELEAPVPEQLELTQCYICGSSEYPTIALKCDGEHCQNEQHFYCCPDIIYDVPSEKWFCSKCDNMGTVKSLNDALNVVRERNHGGVVSENTLGYFLPFSVQSLQAIDDCCDQYKQCMWKDQPSELLLSEADIIGKCVTIFLPSNVIHSGRIVSRYDHNCHCVVFRSGADGRNKICFEWVCLEDVPCILYDEFVTINQELWQRCRRSKILRCLLRDFAQGDRQLYFNRLRSLGSTSSAEQNLLGGTPTSADTFRPSLSPGFHYFDSTQVHSSSDSVPVKLLTGRALAKIEVEAQLEVLYRYDHKKANQSPAYYVPYSSYAWGDIEQLAVNSERIFSSEPKWTSHTASAWERISEHRSLDCQHGIRKGPCDASLDMAYLLREVFPTHRSSTKPAKFKPIQLMGKFKEISLTAFRRRGEAVIEERFSSMQDPVQHSHEGDGVKEVICEHAASKYGNLNVNEMKCDTETETQTGTETENENQQENKDNKNLAHTNCSSSLIAEAVTEELFSSYLKKMQKRQPVQQWRLQDPVRHSHQGDGVKEVKCEHAASKYGNLNVNEMKCDTETETQTGTETENENQQEKKIGFGNWNQAERAKEKVIEVSVDPLLSVELSGCNVVVTRVENNKTKRYGLNELALSPSESKANHKDIDIRYLPIESKVQTTEASKTGHISDGKLQFSQESAPVEVTGKPAKYAHLYDTSTPLQQRILGNFAARQRRLDSSATHSKGSSAVSLATLPVFSIRKRVLSSDVNAADGGSGTSTAEFHDVTASKLATPRLSVNDEKHVVQVKRPRSCYESHHSNSKSHIDHRRHSADLFCDDKRTESDLPDLGAEISRCSHVEDAFTRVVSQHKSPSVIMHEPPARLSSAAASVDKIRSPSSFVSSSTTTIRSCLSRKAANERVDETSSHIARKSVHFVNPVKPDERPFAANHETSARVTTHNTYRRQDFSDQLKQTSIPSDGQRGNTDSNYFPQDHHSRGSSSMSYRDHDATHRGRIPSDGQRGNADRNYYHQGHHPRGSSSMSYRDHDATHRR